MRQPDRSAKFATEPVIGPIDFDRCGDITGPFRLWRIEHGSVTTIGQMTAKDVSNIQAELNK
jgi:hypothetical protein